MMLCLTACLGIGLDDARPQDKAKEPPELGWSNRADLSLVLTGQICASRGTGLLLLRDRGRTVDIAGPIATRRCG